MEDLKIPDPDFRKLPRELFMITPKLDVAKIQETAVSLQESLDAGGFNKADIGNYMIKEVFDFYHEQRADELNAALLALLPGGVVRVGVIPVPMGAIKLLLAKVLDKITPEVPLRLMVEILRKAKLTTL